MADASPDPSSDTKPGASSGPSSEVSPDAPAAPAYTLAQITGYFLKLGALGFGGPVALVEYMRRDLVERRGWIAEADYRDGLALSQLAPGPLAAQLAIYLGYVHHRFAGATLAGLAFVLPSFVLVVALGWAYLRFGGLPWMQAVFYGVGACVIGIIAHSARKLTKSAIGRDRLLWAVYLVSAAVTIVTRSEWVPLFFAAGAVVWIARVRPRFGARPAALALSPIAPLSTLTTLGAAAPAAGAPALGQLFGFFVYAGAFVFGSGLAIVPFLYGGVVQEHGWLTEQQFVDAVAVAMITPGPVVITTAFIGYLLAGFAGACVAAVGTFLPAYLFTIVPAPYFKRHGKRPGVAAFVDGVTAAAIGAITGAVFVLGQRSIVDLPTAALAAVTLVILWKYKLPEPLLVAAAAVLGLLIHPLARGG